MGLEAANRSTFVGTLAPGPVAAGVPVAAVVVAPAVPAVLVVRALLPAAADRSTSRSMMARAKRWQWPPVRAGYQVAVDHDVLVRVDRAHVADVADQVVVGDHWSAADQLRQRRDQPHPVADDPLDDDFSAKARFMNSVAGGAC